MLVPASIDELKAMVLDHPRVLASGGRTKNRLHHHHGVDDRDCVPLSLRGLTGITEYEPSEYTFTALAGTPVREIQAALQEKGQFLPCSALLSDSGATLGGAIASGLSGAGRFRFGGLRDFLLGVRYVSGEGELIAGGGKVVKNAAGFDLPKFMVGSLGCYGILAEVTFKVFPAPSSVRTLRVSCDSHERAAERLVRSASARWELYALDYQGWTRSIYLRLGGPGTALDCIAGEIVQEWAGEVEVLDDEEGDAFWHGVREIAWAPEGGAMVKVPLTPKKIASLQLALEAIGVPTVHYSSGGNVAFVSVSDGERMEALSKALTTIGLQGMTFRGDPEVPLWIGFERSRQIDDAVKQAFDPRKRFPSMR